MHDNQNKERIMDRKKKGIIFISLFLIIGMGVYFIGCGGDDDDDDNDDDARDDDTEDDDTDSPDDDDTQADDDDTSPDPENADTLIITSNYSNRYHIFSGDTYEHLDVIEPLSEGMQGVDYATIVELGGKGMHFVLFSSNPAESGHDEMFGADAYTGANPLRLTYFENEGFADIVPAGAFGVFFIAVQSGATPEVMKLEATTGTPSVYKGSGFTKNIEQYICETTRWESPDYSPAGLFAAGWHCQDPEGPDTASFSTVITMEEEEDSDDCGSIVWKRKNDYAAIEDLCFTYDGTMVIFSVGHNAEEKQVIAAKVDSDETEQDLTAWFNGGHIQNFDCDPTGGRIVYNELETNANLFILEYEVGDGEILTQSMTPEQITTDNVYRRPRWVKN